MPDLKATLEEAETVAVVGCSEKPFRTSHKIASYLQEVGYRVIPINPHLAGEEVLGEPCYPDLQHVPEGTDIDIVDVFRRPEYTAEMVQMVVDCYGETDRRPAVWTQIGVSSSEAEQLAKEAGFPYVKNRCILVEHGRLIGSSGVGR